MSRKAKNRLMKYLDSMLTDRLVASVVLFIIIAYILFFGYYHFFTISSIPLDGYALIILLPILLTDSIKTLIEAFSRGELPKVTYEDPSKVTAIIPTRNGEPIIEQTLSSLLKKFSKENIIVASNGSTDDTCAVARKVGVRVIDVRDPVGKVHAINLALEHISTPYTLIIDDDTLLDNAKLPINLLDSGYEGVAFRVLPVKVGWLSILQLHEYRKSMDIGRGFHNASATVQTVSGAIGLFHTKELLRQVHIHSREFSGEDLQRTLLILQLKNKKGVVIADTTVRTYVPGTIGELFSQRIFGWYPGLYANFTMYLRIMFQKQVPLRLRYDAFFTCFLVVLMDPIRVFTLPILLFSPTYFLIFFVSYTLLELIPYLLLGRKEPFWVVLLAPFYGLFNFVARFLGGAVFIYRRLSYKLGKAAFYDEYKYVRKYARLFSGLITIFIYMCVFIFYNYIVVLPSNVKEGLNSDIHGTVQDIVRSN